jgi:lactam utilization protein B
METVDSVKYRTEALEIAAEEVLRRGLDLEKSSCSNERSVVSSAAESGFAAAKEVFTPKRYTAAGKTVACSHKECTAEFASPCVPES